MKLLHQHLTSLDEVGSAYSVKVEFESGKSTITNAEVFGHDEHSLNVAYEDTEGCTYHQFVNLCHDCKVTVTNL